jgi:hypothetical protein
MAELEPEALKKLESNIATLVAKSKETEGISRSEKRKGPVEITEGKKADTGASYRGVLYVLVWIGVVFFHNFLKENHGGVSCSGVLLI